MAGRSSPAAWCKATAEASSSISQVVLLAEVIADLHQHCDAFGIAGLGDGCRIGTGAELPAIGAGNHRDFDSIGTIGMDRELGARHRDQFGSGLDGLAHGAPSSQSQVMTLKRQEGPCLPDDREAGTYRPRVLRCSIRFLACGESSLNRRTQITSFRSAQLSVSRTT